MGWRTLQKLTGAQCRTPETSTSDTTDNDLQDLAETVTQLAKHLRAAAHRSEDDYLYLSIDAAYITAATALAAHTTKTSQTDQ